MFDSRLALMTGVDIPVPELQLVAHQPSITEISYIGESDFFTAIHYLCLNKENLIEDKSLLEDLTNFQVLMKVIEQLDSKEKKAAITQVLMLFFPTCKVSFTPRGIAFFDAVASPPLLLTTVDDSNFEALQNVLKTISCADHIFSNKDEVVFNPQGALAKKIADKIYAGRRKKAAMQEQKQNKESILSRYVSILTVGIHSMTLKDCNDLTLYQLFDLIDRYSLYQDWDIDIRARLAGAQPDSETENWMKNIH